MLHSCQHWRHLINIPSAPLLHPPALCAVLRCSRMVFRLTRWMPVVGMYGSYGFKGPHGGHSAVDKQFDYIAQVAKHACC